LFREAVEEGEVLAEVEHARLEYEVTHADVGVARDLLGDERGRPHETGPAFPRRLVANAVARADGEDQIGAEPPQRLALLEDLPDLPAHRLRIRPRRVEARSEARHAPQGGRHGAPDPQRRIRLLARLGEAAGVVEAEELPGVFGALVCPAALHRPQRLVAPRPAPLEGNAEDLDLLAQPAHAGADDDAALRQM